VTGMASLVRKVSLALLLAGLGVICASDGVVFAADAKDAEYIMKKVNGKKGLTTKISTAIKDGKWDDAQKMAKELKELTADLGKNDPHKGDKSSWEKLAKKYAEEGAAVADAVEKKDAKEANKAIMTFTTEATCKGCHKSHK
jgi:hypothetical protein